MPNVLIVDDNDLVREVGYRLLLKLGHAVQAASDGPEAMAILRSAVVVDYLFSDVMMPGGMDGIELAKAAAALRPNLKIILVTGNLEQAQLREEALPNVFAILPKPYRRQKLADLIAG